MKLINLFEFEKPNNVVIELTQTEAKPLTNIINDYFDLSTMQLKHVIDIHRGPAVINARKKYEQHYKNISTIIYRQVGNAETITETDIAPCKPLIDQYIQTQLIDKVQTEIPCRVVPFNLGESSTILACLSTTIFRDRVICEFTISYKKVIADKYVKGNTQKFIIYLLSAILHEFIHYLQTCKKFSGQPIKEIRKHFLKELKNSKELRNINLQGTKYLSHDNIQQNEINFLAKQYDYYAKEEELQAYAAQAVIELLEYYTLDHLINALTNAPSDEWIEFAGKSFPFGIYLMYGKLNGGESLFLEFIKRVSEQLLLYRQGIEPDIVVHYLIKD